MKNEDKFRKLSSGESMLLVCMFSAWLVIGLAF
jgi:hypothetical protein